MQLDGDSLDPLRQDETLALHRARLLDRPGTVLVLLPATTPASPAASRCNSRACSSDQASASRSYSPSGIRPSQPRRQRMNVRVSVQEVIGDEGAGIRQGARRAAVVRTVPHVPGRIPV